ncbi:hypothetical protein SMC26_11155 [Actinomadura fulvescens]|uniref:Glycosyltransferase RgtA/B/C/D-like domain-containing protein n=1 Tax=Actinomadura fulvescens TaxID=46160 RepID=A0ABP6C6Z2_9ACTN
MQPSEPTPVQDPPLRHPPAQPPRIPLTTRLRVSVRARLSMTGRATLTRMATALEPPLGPRLRAVSRRHPVFTVLLACAALLRVITMIGYQPALFFNDSYDYIHVAMQPYPHPLRPDGYALLLLVVRPFHSFALVTAIQHLMGLAMGVMIYALARRRFRLPGWGAALAAAPVLLDAYQLQLEHLILSDTTFTFLAVSAVCLLLWHDRLTWRLSTALGLLAGFSWLTRSVGLLVLLGVLAFMVVRRVDRRMVMVMLAAALLPVVAYMGWYKADHGKFAMTESNGIFLYARVYKFADCHQIKNLPVEEMPLCTELVNRLPTSQDGIWNAGSPLARYTGKKFSPETNATANDFSKRVIMAQPGDYARVVAKDFLRVFAWERTVFPDRATYQQYEFGTKTSDLPKWMQSSGTVDQAVRYEGGPVRPRAVEPFAGFLRVYQDVFYLRGTMVGVLLLIGLAGIGAMWRRLGGAALLPWSLATGLLLAPAATAEFDYRYVLPAVPLACLAAAIACSPEFRDRLRVPRRPRRPAPVLAPDDSQPDGRVLVP